MYVHLVGFSPSPSFFGRTHHNSSAPVCVFLFLFLFLFFSYMCFNSKRQHLGFWQIVYDLCSIYDYGGLWPLPLLLPLAILIFSSHRNSICGNCLFIAGLCVGALFFLSVSAAQQTPFQVSAATIKCPLFLVTVTVVFLLTSSTLRFQYFKCRIFTPRLGLRCSTLTHDGPCRRGECKCGDRIFES